MIRLCDLKLDMIANRDCCLRSLYNYTIQEKEMRVLQKPKNVQATEIYTLTKWIVEYILWFVEYKLPNVLF